MKEARQRAPEVYGINVTDLDHSTGIAEGKVIYHYSERAEVWPRQTKKRENLTARGYYHKKSEDQRNGRMVFVKKAKVEVEMSVRRGNKVKTYTEDVTPKMNKLTGAEKNSPEEAENLANRINGKKIVVFLVQNRLFVEKR